MNDDDRNHRSESERQALYRVLRQRDADYDGRFFVGVSSTGIYCRPVCPVHLPKFENCTFHDHPAIAEKSGFRPCLVCRPELAPGEFDQGPRSELAYRALRRIEDGALNQMSVDELALEFNISARHLRRELTEAYGVSPIELAQTQRLLHAKQLLSETDLSITEVAFAAGFESLRRFNALFKSRYRLTPGDLRRQAVAKLKRGPGLEHEASLSLRIDYRPPLNWTALLNFLMLRAIPGVESVDHGVYRRTAQIGPHHGWLTVEPWPQKPGRRQVHGLKLSLSAGLQPVSAMVSTRIKNLFDVRANTGDIDRLLSADRLLRDVVNEHQGMRVPGAFDSFELLLRAILGQLVSVKAATTLSGRMASAFGQPIATPWPQLTHLTPQPSRIAAARIEQIAAIGLPQKRAEAVRAAALAWQDGSLMLEPGNDPQAAIAQLTALPGIGEWTAAYVAMRALAWTDAIPLGDLGIKKALGLTRGREILARTETWRPYRAYGAIYLWLSLSSGG